MIGRLVPVPARDTKARTSVVTHNGDRVRIHPASTNSKLRVEKPEDLRDDDDEGPPPPQFAALLFFDEITRGDSMLCKRLRNDYIGYVLYCLFLSFCLNTPYYPKY